MKAAFRLSGLYGLQKQPATGTNGLCERLKGRITLILDRLAAPAATGMMSGRNLLRSPEQPIMISLIQRVSSASVTVDGDVKGSISRGLLVFLAVQPDDEPGTTARMAQRVLTYRVFPDDSDRMNRSLVDDDLELLVVPQFTLAANTAKGTRPSFTSAAPPEKGEQYFTQFLAECRKRLPTVESGVFGANMEVSLVNDGPVTFWLEA